MRAAAVALVLIVGAAVVLWFANTSNSSVLAGLIGGLAAILLSIPITLLIFLSIARRHEEKTQAQERERAFLARELLYEAQRREIEAETYEAEDEFIPREQVRESYNRYPASRQLQTSDSPRLPAAGQSHASPRTTNVLRQSNKQTKMLKQQPGPTTSLRNKNATSTRGLPAQQPRNPHLTSALHQIRQESLNQQENDIEVVPHTTTSIRRAAPATRSLANQPAPQNNRRTPREASPPVQRSQSERDRWSEEVDLPPYNYAEYQSEHEASTSGPSGKTGSSYKGQVYRTTGEYLRDHARETDEMSRQNLERNLGRTTEAPLGSLKNPLVRRPPYLYEDDPLREELSRQIDAEPLVRRTTRATKHLESYDEQNDDIEFEGDF